MPALAANPLTYTCAGRRSAISRIAVSGAVFGSCPRRSFVIQHLKRGRIGLYSPSFLPDTMHDSFACRACRPF